MYCVAVIVFYYLIELIISIGPNNIAKSTRNSGLFELKERKNYKTD